MQNYDENYFKNEFKRDLTFHEEIIIKIIGIRIDYLKSKIELLEKSDLKLQCLEQAGVDNWDGWDDAMEIYYEYLEDKKKDT
jgi:hypothetical protein